MKPLFVLISGKRLSGKDTLANAIASYMDNSLVTHLADAIRVEVMHLYPTVITNITQLMDNSDPIKLKYRPELIRIGQERRAEDVDYWCKRTLEAGIESGAEVVLVPDVRFPNELTYFRDKMEINTYAIRINATPEARASRGYVFTPGVDDDVSEISLDLPLDHTDWDALLVDAGVSPYLFVPNVVNAEFGSKSWSIAALGTVVGDLIIPHLNEVKG